MQPNYEREIQELHQFFVDWMSGKLPKTDEAYGRFVNVVHQDFNIIGPNGQLTPRDALLKGLYETHGGREDFRIWVVNPRLHHENDLLVIATYEEWQEIDNHTTTRLSTAIFVKDVDAPNGLHWLHVHETWLADKAPSTE